MPKGIPNSGGLGPSENTQRLMEAMRELEERIAVEKAKDRARALLLHFAQKHGLSAVDLRNAARVLADRKVGDAPIATKTTRKPGKVSTHLLKPPKGKVGKAIRAARLKLNMSDTAIGDAIGCHSSMVGKWQMGADVPARYHEPLTKILKLPDGLWPKANGAAHGGD